MCVRPDRKCLLSISRHDLLFSFARSLSDRRPHTLFDFKNESESKKIKIEKTVEGMSARKKRKTDYFIAVVLIG